MILNNQTPDKIKERQLEVHRENNRKFWKSPGIIPDSLELEVAFWETYRSDVLINEYASGKCTTSIARERGRSRKSLEIYFRNRYGKNWKKRRPRGTPRVRMHKEGGSLTVTEILNRLRQGERHVEIALRFNVPACVVYSKVKRHKLSEGGAVQ